MMGRGSGAYQLNSLWCWYRFNDLRSDLRYRLCRSSGCAAISQSPAEKKANNFKTLCLTSLVWKLQSWQASGAKRFHGKPPLIGLGVHRRSGGGRVQTFAIIRFLFGRALRLQCLVDGGKL